MFRFLLEVLLVILVFGFFSLMSVVRIEVEVYFGGVCINNLYLWDINEFGLERVVSI